MKVTMSELEMRMDCSALFQFNLAKRENSIISTCQDATIALSKCNITVSASAYGEHKEALSSSIQCNV